MAPPVASPAPTTRATFVSTARNPYHGPRRQQELGRTPGRSTCQGSAARLVANDRGRKGPPPVRPCGSACEQRNVRRAPKAEGPSGGAARAARALAHFGLEEVAVGPGAD